MWVRRDAGRDVSSPGGLLNGLPILLTTSAKPATGLRELPAQRSRCLPVLRSAVSGQSCLCLENPEVRELFYAVWVARLALPIDGSLGPSLGCSDRVMCQVPAAGFMFCQREGCKAVTKDPGKYVFCSHHHPLQRPVSAQGIVPTGAAVCQYEVLAFVRYRAEVISTGGRRS